MQKLHLIGVFVVIEGIIGRIENFFWGRYQTGTFIALADTAQVIKREVLSLRNIVKMKEYHYGARGIPSGPS